jgi:hypothetical protein
MRQDSFNELLEIGGQKILFNSRACETVIISDDLFHKLQNLSKGEFFNDSELKLDFSTKKKFIEKGFLINYSQSEYTEIVSKESEKFREIEKCSAKTPALILDKESISCWCNRDDEERCNYEIVDDKLGTLINDLKEYDKIDSISLFFSKLTRKIEDQINCILGKYDIKISKIFTTEESSVFIRFFNQLNNEKLKEITIIQKPDKRSSIVYIYKPTTDLQIELKGKKHLYIDRKNCFCPFKYSIYFVDMEGNLYDCLLKLATKTHEKNIYHNHSKTIYLNYGDGRRCDKEKITCSVANYCMANCQLQYHVKQDELQKKEECINYNYIKGMITEKVQLFKEN